MSFRSLVVCLFAAGCGPTMLSPGSANAELDQGCLPGTACAPIAVAAFPFTHHGDTRTGGEDVVDRYSCAPSTTEGGNEVWYAVQVPSAGRLTVSHPEYSGDSVDVDVHILSAADANRCVARGHADASASLQAGTVYVVVDTWAGRDGRPMAGAYDLTIDLELLPTGACAVVEQDLPMHWSSCDSSVPDCFKSGSTTYLSLPTTGPVVKEAHLVTNEDGISGWPTSSRDRLSAHYATSQGISGYTMTRSEPWAPSGEGGSQWGQGSTGSKIPADAEAWYINMYWKTLPARGTRMIVRNPANGRAVVAAAGYETGPGDNSAVAGVAEEIHDWLGTGHLDDLEIGFAADTSLPYGPISCATGAPPSGGGSGGSGSGGTTPPAPSPSTDACYLGATRAGTTCHPTAALPSGTNGYAVTASSDPQFAAPARYLDLSPLDPDEVVAPNFLLHELASEDDGRYAILQPSAVAHLQRVRDAVGALNVTLGYAPGPQVSASSRHPWGDAFDLDPVSASVSRVADACRSEGADYVEAFSSYVHCDWRNDTLDGAFFGTSAPTSSVVVPNVVVDLQWDGDRLVAPATGFEDEGDAPLLEWTAFDAAGAVIDRTEGPDYTPVTGTATVEVVAGRLAIARIDL